MLARPGDAIGVGGSPAIAPGVVRRVALEVDVLAVATGQLGLVAGRGVDPERDPLAEPVVDHPGDLGRSASTLVSSSMSDATISTS